MISSTSTMDHAVSQTPAARPWRRRLLALAALLAIGAIAFLLPAMRRWSRADRAVDGSRLRLAQVTRGDLERDVSAQGRIVAGLHPTLFSPAQGRVQLSVKAGTDVKKGQPLARVESPELRSRLAQERQTLMSLQADLGRQEIASRQARLRSAQNVDILGVRLAASRRGLERSQSLFDQGLLNRTDYEKTQDEVQVATLELKNAQQTAELEKETLDFEVKNRAMQAGRQTSITRELERQVEELTIVAPFDGMVATVSVQDRDAVAANQPLLMVVNLSSFEVEFDLPENYASDVLPGTRAEVLYEGKTYAGHVITVSPEIKDSQVKGTLAFEGEPPSGLRQSQRVSTRMVLERKPDVLKVARGPFLENGGGRQAYVVEGGVAVKRSIRVGAISVSEVELIEGVREGERIVVSDTSMFEGANTVLVRD